MMKTEKDARLQWCPMVRAASGDDDNNSANAGVEPGWRVPEYSMCIASQCAMWVNDAMPARGFAIPKPGFQYSFSEASAGTKPKNIPESWVFMPAGEWDDLAGWLEPEEETRSRRTGRCGLIHR